MKRNRIYRKIWEDAYGPIPKGYHIHHIDGNYTNNELSNLECLSPKEHAKKHPHMVNFISESYSACLKGGKTQGRKNKENGHWDKISNIGRAKKIRIKAVETCRKRKNGLFGEKNRLAKLKASKILQKEKRGIFSKESREKIIEISSKRLKNLSFNERSRMAKLVHDRRKNNNPEGHRLKQEKLQMSSRLSKLLWFEIIHLGTGNRYKIVNINEFARRNGISVGNLRATCNGSRKSANGWKAIKLEKISKLDHELLDEKLFCQIKL